MTDRNRPLTAACFGDIHGRVGMMVELALRWQERNGRRLDAILQVGDFGAFPDPTRLDDATRKHASRDPDELGFSRLVIGAPEFARTVGSESAPPILFIRGNHEDFDYLGRFDTPGTVDPWGRVTYLPDGTMALLQPGDAVEAVTVAAFGGVNPTVEQKGRGRAAREAYKRALRRAEVDPRRFTPGRCERAFFGQPAPDVLLTHAGPRCSRLQDGSSLLEQLAARLRPRIHLFGHHHQVVAPFTTAAGVLTVGLEHLEKDHDGQVRKGSWGILEIGRDRVEFVFA